MSSQKNLSKSIHPFEFNAAYTALDSHAPKNAFDSHIHDKCEIHLNPLNKQQKSGQNRLNQFLTANSQIYYRFL